MKMVILSLSQRQPGWIQEGFATYADRLPADYRLELRELKPEARRSGSTTASLLRAEAVRLEASLPAGARVVVLDERGDMLSTRELASRLERWRDQAQQVAFVIGSADGLDPAFRQQAHERIRLSSMTLPHGLVRVLLAEQIYRAWAILNDHPYHRD